MESPFILPPHPLAQEAAREVMDSVHEYMNAHPESELHRQGKMFGVLVVKNEGGKLKTESGKLKTESRKLKTGRGEENGEWSYLAAFSAMLDGKYEHEGFVPPVYAMSEPPVGHNKAESQRLQRLLFAQYRFTNVNGESKNLLEIFENEKPILSPEAYFEKTESGKLKTESLPPSGAGECCAPKLLQYALTHGMEPLYLAEFWVGAPPRNELRREGTFYAPCSGRCKPILRWMIGDVRNERVNELKSEGIQIDILYEDKYLMVIDKPAGLLSVPGKSEEVSVESYCAAKPVHRLDQDTSGVLVLAKSSEVYKELQAYFQRRDILKRYEAVLERSEGVKELRNEGVIDLPLLPNPYDRPRQMVEREHGKPAITRYKVRERRADGTVLVDFFPLTGRTHQLRVHAAHPEGLDSPIVGDRLYGTPADRLYLHAAEIAFVHPVTKKEMHFCIPSSF